MINGMIAQIGDIFYATELQIFDHLFYILVGICKYEFLLNNENNVLVMFQQITSHQKTLREIWLLNRNRQQCVLASS